MVARNKDVETPRKDLNGTSRQLGVSTYELDGVSGFSFRGCLAVSSMVLLRGIRNPTYELSHRFPLDAGPMAGGAQALARVGGSVI